MFPKNKKQALPARLKPCRVQDNRNEDLKGVLSPPNKCYIELPQTPGKRVHQECFEPPKKKKKFQKQEEVKKKEPEERKAPEEKKSPEEKKETKEKKEGKEKKEEQMEISEWLDPIEWHEGGGEDYIDLLLKSQKKPTKQSRLYEEIKRENKLKYL